MEWRDITFTVGQKEILQGVSGLLEPGRLVGIMGPSGCGKTTLLNVLSGRQRTSGTQKGKTASQRVEVKGTLSACGEEKKPKDFQKLVAYVFQENAWPEFETPRDCLNFSAFLRLPRSVSGEEREALVKSMLERLNLELCADTIVGSLTRKGISGGEQKRTAVGIELISKPKMIFLDEPLSGLDAYNAYSLMQSLRTLAASGVPVMMTLHQPSSEIYALLDDLVVMHEGEICYHGPAEGVAGHLELLGFPSPEGYSPTDHLMCLMQGEKPEVVRQVKDQWLKCGAYQNLLNRMSNLQREEEVEEDLEGGETSDGPTDTASEVDARTQQVMPANRHQKGMCLTLCTLLGRDLRRIKRTFCLFMSTYVLQDLLCALVYSLLFFGPSCAASLYEPTHCYMFFVAHLKLLSIVCFVVIFSSVPYATETLQQERHVFLRERAGGYYEVLPYFFSKLVFELPQVFLQCLAMLIGTYWLVGLRGNFLWLLLELEVLALTSTSLMYIFSAGCSTPDKAQAMAGLPLTLQFAFSGMLIPIQSIPQGMQWLKWLCPMYYGMGMLGATEFSYVFRGAKECETAIECDSYQLRLDALRAYNITEEQFFWPNLLMCGVMIVSFRTVAAVLLWWKSRYVQ